MKKIKDRMKRISWIILGWLTLLATAQAASFDCEKAVSTIEKTICGDDELSKLDEKLYTAYKNALQNDKHANSIRHSEEQWIKDRNHCTDAACMKIAYEKRITELTSIADSRDTDSNVHKPLDCQQCGVWAISDADEVGSLHHENVGYLDGPVGNYILIDDNTITIPYCGSFSYQIKTSTTKEQDGKIFHEYKMPLEKVADSLLCEGNGWTLTLSIYSGAFDKMGQAIVLLETADEGINPRQFNAWNIARVQPDQTDGTPGIGQVIKFKIAEITEALAVTTVRMYRGYVYDKATPFDVARFSAKAERYCEDYYKDTPYNPSIGDLMLECQYKIMTAKFDEFRKWHCVDRKASNTKKVCSLPTESLK
ncbi:MAG: lysozyme inhibitor LprI family protein [Sulfuricaulis sp.]